MNNINDLVPSGLTNSLPPPSSLPEKVISLERVKEVGQSKLQNIQSNPPPRPLYPAPLPSSSSRTRSNAVKDNSYQQIQNQRMQSNLGGGVIGPPSSEGLSPSLFSGVQIQGLATDPAFKLFSTAVNQEAPAPLEASVAKPVKKLEEEGLQMDYIYRLADSSPEMGLVITDFGDVEMVAFKDIPAWQQEEHFDALIEMIRTRAKSSESPVCELVDGLKITYSELLQRLSSSAWGQQVMKNHPELQVKLGELRQKLIWIEFNISTERDKWLTKKEAVWQKKGKDVEKTLLTPPCKIFYRAKSQHIYIMPLNIQEGSLHFLGRGQFKSASRLLNYTTGEILACCDMEKLTKPERVAIKEGESKNITPTAIKEVECLEKLKDTPGVINLVDHLEYVTKEEGGKKSKRLIMITPLYEGGTLGRRGVVRETYTQLDRKDKIEIMRELLLGLQAIHGKGVVHHDIDISNILMKKNPMTNKWHAAIFDFGQAELSSWGKEAKNLVAKSAYTDIFEMGKVFYRLFIDSKTKYTFKGEDWKKDYKMIYDRLTDPDLPIKQAIMQMLSPIEMRLDLDALLLLIAK